MPKTCRPGNIIKGYTITDQINNGAMAISYAARSPSGEKVFFKQYKSPSVSVGWYKAYVSYQQELKRRVEAARARNYCYRMIEFFEFEWGCRTFFQVFEFVSGGLDMEQVLEKLRANRLSVGWDQRLIMAKVMMAGIDALHEAKIVHCDLKPPNIQLLRDTTIKAGYQLKLIDMDFSILADIQAPWHGQNNYVGSPHYFSPEHFSGAVPTAASDVFTCGLILYELLGQGHPYLSEDDDAYARAVRSHSAPRVKLCGSLAAPASADLVADYLHRCLSPRAGDRPTAKEINLALNGRVSPVPAPTSPATVRRSAPAAPERPSPPSTTAPRPLVEKKSSGPAAPVYAGLELASPSGKAVQLRIRTEIGKALCQQFGDEAIYVDVHQFTLDRHTDGNWFVLPNAAAKNQTLLNGKLLDVPTPLKSGDVLAVGNSNKGVSKLPLKVNLI